MIVNPRSGKVRPSFSTREIVDLFADNNFEVGMFFTAPDYNADFLVREHAADFDIVACCGGDGTVSETIKGMMEAEMENQKEETQKTEPDYSDQRNGYKTKTVRSNYGPVEIDVPQDRKSDYEPKIVPKYSRDISGIDDKIIRMYAGGMSVSEISEQIEEIYGCDVSEGLVTGVTNKILPKIDEWQRRPLCPIYPIVFIDAIVFNVRDEGSIQKKAAVSPGRRHGEREILADSSERAEEQRRERHSDRMR